MSDIKKLTTEELQMFLNPHYGMDYLKSEGWELNSNGYSVWFESDTKEYGIRRVSMPGWVNERIDSASKHGAESALRPIRDALGITDMFGNEVFVRKETNER